jgi:ribosomal protein RSM22 (predicted rRNA methylase)
MASVGDWCHFAARVERTAEHRRLKDATLGHEDEKFSYVAFARPEVQIPQARIVRHPKIFSGYAQLALCREGEIANSTVTRSMKEDWRRLKRLGWGDRW